MLSLSLSWTMWKSFSDPKILRYRKSSWTHHGRNLRWCLWTLVMQVQIQLDYQTLLIFPYRTTGDSQTEQRSCWIACLFKHLRSYCPRMNTATLYHCHFTAFDSHTCQRQIHDDVQQARDSCTNQTSFDSAAIAHSSFVLDWILFQRLYRSIDSTSYPSWFSISLCEVWIEWRELRVRTPPFFTLV